MTAAIPFGEVDDTSTATAFTATVPGITELRDGVCVLLRNGVVTSDSGCTLNINGLGAKRLYSSMAASTAISTTFNINYTMLFVYDSTRVEGGCWVAYYGYYTSSNTIGYQVRTNSTRLPMADRTYRYRLLFRSVDGKSFVPANTSTSTNATAARTTCTIPIDPFGEICYYGTTSAVAANAMPSAAYLWQQYVVTLGYSFNNTGSALTLNQWEPVYITATPQADGSAILDYFTQSKPTTNDGKIYIYLGIAVSETTVEMSVNHPVYYHNGTGIRLWTGGN